MIPLLLSKYHKFLNLYSVESSETVENNRAFYQFNFYYSEKILRLGIFVWLGYQMLLFYKLAKRPEVLFEPMTYFSRWFIPEFPPEALIIFIVVTAGIANALALLKPGIIFNKVVLAFCIAYLNTLNWSYGFMSHVGHFFVLTNLFIIFINPKFPEKRDLKGGEIAKCIQWFFLGLMFTYSFAGVWKVVGLLVRFTFKPNGISWLNPDAALYNAVAGYVFWDLPLGDIFKIYEVPVIWQFLFLVTVLLQLFSFASAYRIALFHWIGAGTIIFHLFNFFFMKIEFVVTPLTIAALFFPYYKIFSTN